MGWSPRCYTPCFVEISALVLEKKIFEGVLPYIDLVVILVLWPASCHQIFISLYLKAFIQNLFQNGTVVPEKIRLIFECTRPWAKIKKWTWPSILTNLHKFNEMSAHAYFQVTGCNSFWKIYCFQFYLWKSPSYKIWPCRKIGRGQPKVVIWTNYDWQETRSYIPSFVEFGLPVPEKIFEGFLPYMGVEAILVMWPRCRSPYPRRLNIKFCFDWPSGSGEKYV